jgi:galacturan 1,4-alpha-galacturonidase
MKFLALGALLVGAVTAVSTGRVPQGAHVISADDKSALRNVGAHGQKYPDRRTVTIRPSKNDTDDISDDFLWGIKHANHGGRLLLQKGKTYVIGKKLDLSFLNNVEVQLEGEIKVSSTC